MEHPSETETETETESETEEVSARLETSRPPHVAPKPEDAQASTGMPPTRRPPRPKR